MRMRDKKQQKLTRKAQETQNAQQQQTDTDSSQPQQQLYKPPFPLEALRPILEQRFKPPIPLPGYRPRFPPAVKPPLPQFEEPGQSDQKGKKRGKISIFKKRTPPNEGQIGSAPDHGEYDPDKHRSSKGINAWQAVAHLLRVSFGTGILGLPLGFSRTGIGAAIILSVVVATVQTHCILIVLKSISLQSKRARMPVVPYYEALKIALESGPPRGKKYAKCAFFILLLFLLVVHFGIACVYIKFFAITTKQMTNDFLDYPVEVHMMLIALPVLIFSLIPNMRILSYFSLLGNILICSAYALLMYFMQVSPRPDHTNIVVFGSYAEIPLFLGTALFTLPSPGAAIYVEKDMKNPKQYRGVCGIFSMTVVITTSVSVVFAILGYNYCRGACQESIMDNLNMDEWVNHVVAPIYMFAILSSFTIQCFIPAAIILDLFRKWTDLSDATLKRFQYVIKAIVFVVAWLIALEVPKLGLYIALLLAIGFPLTGMLVPVLMDALESSSVLTLVKDGIIFVFGIIIMVAAICAVAIEIDKDSRNIEGKNVSISKLVW